MKLYAGMDLHSTNVVTQLIDESDKVLYRKKQSCDLEQILKGLEPFKDSIESIAVESTYNWYWLVDGLMAAGYRKKGSRKKGSGLIKTRGSSGSYMVRPVLRSEKGSSISLPLSIGQKNPASKI